MNLVAGSLVYHSDEAIALHLMTILMNEYQLKDVYSNNLQGVIKHNAALAKVIKDKLPSLH